MAFIIPPPPDELMKLLKGQGQGEFGQPSQPAGLPGQPPPVAGMPRPGIAPTVAGMPAAAMGALRQPAQPVQPAVKAPAPSDDPSVSSMGAVPQVPDFGEFIRQGMARRQAAEDKLSALHNPTPEEYKPSIWRRLLSIPLATAAGLGNPQAGATASDQILHGRFNRAQAQYNSEAAPIKQQLEESKEDFPLYTAAGEAAHRQFTGQMDVAKENRERFTAKSNSDYKSDLNEIRTNIAADKLDQAQKALTEKEAELERKKEHDKDWYEMQGRLMDIRKELADAKRDKEEKGKDKSSQFRTVASQKASAITKANSKYDRATADLKANDVEGHKQAMEEKVRDLQEAQDAYEEGITTLGGSVEHNEVTPSGWKKSGTQPEPESKPTTQQPQQEVKSLNGHSVGQVVKLKDGSSVKITKMYADGRFEHEPAK